MPRSPVPEASSGLLEGQDLVKEQKIYRRHYLTRAAARALQLKSVEEELLQNQSRTEGNHGILVSAKDLGERQAYVVATGYKIYDPRANDLLSLSGEVGPNLDADPVDAAADAAVSELDHCSDDPGSIEHLTSQVDRVRIKSQSLSQGPNSTPTKRAAKAFVVDELRAKDHEFCKQHFAGKVYQVGRVEDLVEAMGGKVMVSRLENGRQVLSGEGKRMLAEGQRQTIFEKYQLESKIRALLPVDEQCDEEIEDTEMEVKEKKEVEIDGTENNQKKALRKLDLQGALWLRDWGEFSRPAGQAFSFEVISAPNKPLPGGHFIKHRRKPDALLALRHDSYSWFDVHLLAEFSNTEGGDLSTGSAKGKKMEQIVMNMNDLLTEQPSRSFSVGISIFKSVFTLSLLDWHGLRMFSVADCFSSSNFYEVSAILSTLLSASIFELGLSPLISYRGSLPVAYDPRALDLDKSADSNLDEIIRLSPIPLSPANYSPFHRGTIVYGENGAAGSENGFRVIKMAHHELFATEPTLLEIIGKIEAVEDSRSYFPSLQSSLILDPFRRLLETGALPEKKEKNPIRPKDVMTIRHLEVLVLATPSRGKSFLTTENLRGHHIGPVFGNILCAIELLWDRANIVHRDVSINNILILEQSFSGCLIDYDCARSYATSAATGRKERTGTKDTMAIALLRNKDGFVHQPIHDIESTVYTFLKVISTFIDSLYKQQYLKDERKDWDEFFESLSWNDGTKKDRDLVSIRRDMWQGEIGRDFTELINKLAKRNRVKCEGLLDFLDQLPDLYTEGVVHPWHGMEYAEEEQEDSRRSKADVPTPEMKAKKTGEIYLVVSQHLKKMFEELATGDDAFLDLLCREHTKFAGGY